MSLIAGERPAIKPYRRLIYTVRLQLKRFSNLSQRPCLLRRLWQLFSMT